MKIGIIGDKKSIQHFSMLKIDVFPATEAPEIRRLIHELAKQDYAVIFIVESAAEKVEETIARYATETFPAIIPIPGSAGNNGLGMEGIAKNVEKAVGMDIFND